MRVARTSRLRGIRRIGLAGAITFMPVWAYAADPALSPGQAEAVDQRIHDYLMNNPQALAEALDRVDSYRKAQAAAKIKEILATHRDELEHTPGTPVLGNPEGDVTIVEFFDYRCPYCRAAAPGMETLLRQDGNVRLVMKEFPIEGPESVFASRVALVADKHGKYAEFHRAMFALSGQITDAVTLEVAKSIGLDPDSVRAETAAPEIANMQAANFELARQIGVRGTPSYIVGDVLIPGAVEVQNLQQAVRSIRAVQRFQAKNAGAAR